MFDEALGKLPIYPQNHQMLIACCCGDVPEIVFEPIQLRTTKPQHYLDLIKSHTRDLLLWWFSIRVRLESLGELSNISPQQDHFRSTHGSNHSRNYPS
jgi:hypothetical protein